MHYSTKEQKVWIFGDSYFQSPILDNPLVSQNSWTAFIEKFYKTKNFAQGGTGLDWSLQQLIINTKKKDTKDDILIFGLGSHYRFNLKFIKEPKYQANYSLDRYKFFSKGKWGIKKYKQDSSIKNISANFLKQFIFEYVLHSTYDTTEFDKVVSYLYFFTKKRFKKVLLFPIFQKFSFNLPKDSKVYMPNFCMADIEFKKIEQEVDPRANHMSDENNIIFYNTINNWIQNNILPDKSLFSTYEERQ